MSDHPYRFRHFYIPQHMMDGLGKYIVHGTEPGGFLTAILENDLREACSSADEENINNIPAYVSFLYNEAPESCWGSPAKVQKWIEKLAAKRVSDFKATASNGPTP